MMVKSTTSDWISVSTRVLQVKTPARMEISSSYKPSETLTMLYTMEELKKLGELSAASLVREISTSEAIERVMQ